MPGTQILYPDEFHPDMSGEQVGGGPSENNEHEVYTPAEFSRLSELFAQAEAGEALSLELEDQHDPELYVAAARFAERMLGGERGQEYAKHFESLADGIRAGQDFGNQYESSFRQLAEEVQQRIVGSVAERAVTIGQETFVEQDKKDSIDELRVAAERGQIYSLGQIPEEYFSDPTFVQDLATVLPEQYGEMKKVLQEKVGSSRFYDLLQNAFDIDNKRIQRNQQRAEQERKAPQIDAAREAVERAAAA